MSVLKLKLSAMPNDFVQGTYIFEENSLPLLRNIDWMIRIEWPDDADDLEVTRIRNYYTKITKRIVRKLR